MTSPQAESRRDSLFRKIRALLAKTTAAGCTEDEALAAAALARRLMDDYDIASTDLEEPNPWTEQDFPNTSPRQRKRDWRLRRAIAGAIGLYCDCRTIHWDDNTIRFFGRESDVLFAGWLLESLDAFGLRAWAIFDAAQSLMDEPDTDAPDRESFLLGYSERIRERLITEAKARTAPTATGSGLILVRNAERDALVAQRYPGLVRVNATRGRMADPRSLAAGSSAADRAGFHRPMAGRTGPLKIGAR